MSTLNRTAADLAKIVDQLSTRIEKRALPPAAEDLETLHLSEVEALALALFAEGRPGIDIEEREEKIALASVIARHASASRKSGKPGDWSGAIERTCPSYGGARWRLGAAVMFEKPSLLPPGAERNELKNNRTRLNRELEQSLNIARRALAGDLPDNTAKPGADRFGTESEITFAKAEGRVSPKTLVYYGAHGFYKEAGGHKPGRSKPKSKSK